MKPTKSVPRPPRSARNTIVFFTDQQRWDSLGLNGNPLDLTPSLDRLGVRGTNFANTFTPNPVCTPARASIITGQPPSVHGVFRLGVDIPANHPCSMATAFQAAGYDTAYIGKWHLSEGLGHLKVLFAELDAHNSLLSGGFAGGSRQQANP